MSLITLVRFANDTYDIDTFDLYGRAPDRETNIVFGMFLLLTYFRPVK
jgi:hypothetical protein